MVAREYKLFFALVVFDALGLVALFDFLVGIVVIVLFAIRLVTDLLA